MAANQGRLAAAYNRIQALEQTVARLTARLELAEAGCHAGTAASGGAVVEDTETRQVSTVDVGEQIGRPTRLSDASERCEAGQATMATGSQLPAAGAGGMAVVETSVGNWACSVASARASGRMKGEIAGERARRWLGGCGAQKNRAARRTHGVGCCTVWWAFSGLVALAALVFARGVDWQLVGGHQQPEGQSNRGARVAVHWMQQDWWYADGGMLTGPWLANRLSMLGLELPATELLEMVHHFDTNGDGRLDAEELTLPSPHRHQGNHITYFVESTLDWALLAGETT